MNILVSACLMGVSCRYDGKHKPDDNVIKLMERHTLIPFCPEVYGGLPTPRNPSQIIGDKVVSLTGDDVTEQYNRGAEEALRIAKLYKCECAVLKERSPSCGSGRIYNGKFDGGLIDGDGITARLLKSNGIPVYGESELSKIK